jgi:hypothetical protein
VVSGSFALKTRQALVLWEVTLFDNFREQVLINKPIPVAVRSKAWVCGCSFAGIVVSNPPQGHGCLSLVSVVCCQVEVSATG